jgi:hypothetical protein
MSADEPVVASATASATQKTSTETMDAVAERLAFFFSDANVRQDFFLRKYLMDKGKSDPLVVPIETLLKFNTLKQHTTEPAVVAQVVKEKLADSLALSDDGLAIKRVKTFTKEMLSENIPLTLYVQNLAIKDDSKNYKDSNDAVRELFTPFGKVALVKFRFKEHVDKDIDDADITPGKHYVKKNRKHPIGDAVVEFENKEGAEKAIAEAVTLKDGETLVPTVKLTLSDSSLVIRTLQDYMAEKERLKEEKRGPETEEAENEVDEAQEEFTLNWKPSCVIRVKGLSSACSREAIFEATAKGLDLSEDQVKEKKIFADFSRGQDDGAIRFMEPEDAIAELCKKLKAGDVEIAGAKVTDAFIVEGEDEKKYWEDFIAFRNKMLKHRHEERRSGGRNKRNNKKQRRN